MTNWGYNVKKLNLREDNEYEKIVRKIVTVYLLIVLIIPSVQVDVASKYVSNKTITTTVDYDMNDDCNKIG